MTPAPLVGLPQLSDSACKLVRSRFAEVGFDEEMMGAGEQVAPHQFDTVRLPLVQMALERQKRPGADLALLFLYDDALSDERAGIALGGPILEVLTSAGVLERANGNVRSRFRITPMAGLWFLHDHPSSGPETAMGPGPTTLELVRWMPTDLSGSVLDVGCGAGTLALIAASRGAQRVIATDINKRALELAAFNARFNGVSVSFRHGSLLEPVKGESFDWVFSQPAYVLRPPDVPEVMYLHGGKYGDELAMSLLAQLPTVLNQGARALVLFDSPVRVEAPLVNRVRKAFAGAPIDVVLFGARGPSADLQAMAYAGLQSPELGSAYRALLTQYRAHLFALEVSEVAHTLVAIRAGSIPGGKFTLSLPSRSLAQVRPDALQAFWSGLDLASSDDKVLEKSSIRPVDAVWVEERDRADLSSDPKRSVRLASGVGKNVEMTEAGFVLLSSLEQSATVGDAIVVYAQACEVEPSEVRSQVIEFVRQGLGRGLLAVLPPRPAKPV